MGPQNKNRPISQHQLGKQALKGNQRNSQKEALNQLETAKE
jgi:hypothetical protein